MTSVLSLVMVASLGAELPLIVIPKLTQSEVVVQLVDPGKSLKVLFRRKLAPGDIDLQSEEERLNLGVTVSPSGTKLLLPIVRQKTHPAKVSGVVISVDGSIETLPTFILENKLELGCLVIGWDGETPCAVDAKVDDPSAQWKLVNRKWKRSSGKLPASLGKIFNRSFPFGPYASSAIVRFSPTWQTVFYGTLDEQGGFHYLPMREGSSRYGTALSYEQTLLLMGHDGIARKRLLGAKVDSLVPIGDGNVVGRSFEERVLIPGFEKCKAPIDPFIRSDVYLWNIDRDDSLHLGEGLFGIPVPRTWAKTLARRAKG